MGGLPMIRSLSQRPFVRRRSPTTTFRYHLPMTLINFRSRFHHASRLSDIEERSAASPPTSTIASKTSGPTLTKTTPVYMPQWQKSKVWSKIFNPYYGKRYKPLINTSTPVPLWDIAPGCIMYLPPESELSPRARKEVQKYGQLGMCGHPVLVLAVDIKGPEEGIVGASTIRTFAQHKDECRFLGLDWFDTTHFEIEQNGQYGLPPPLEHNIKRLRLYKSPQSNLHNSVRQFIQSESILTVPYQELLTEIKFQPDSWWPSAALDAWGRRIIKEDFMQICEAIGFTPDPWHSSGPYMWKNFVEKTGINTFGFDLEDPALYDEKAFYLQMWEEGKAKYEDHYKAPSKSQNDYSPLRWKFDRIPYVKGGTGTPASGSRSLIRRSPSPNHLKSRSLGLA